MRKQEKSTITRDEIVITGVRNLVSLRDYCRQEPWPRLAQWQHWIYERKEIALQCVKKIGGRYMLDVKAFQEYLKGASIDE